MWEFLQESMWQFIISMIVGITAVAVPIIVYLKQRQRKELSYEITSSTPLLSVEDEIKGKLQILYEGKTIQQVHLIVTRILNSGNVPIESKHYERPVSLSFGNEAQVLVADIVKTSPDNLDATIKVEKEKVVLSSTLLNGGDIVTLKALVSKFDEVTVDGRIVGVRKIKEFVQFSIFSFALLLASLGIMIAGLIGILTMTLTSLGLEIDMFITDIKFWLPCLFVGYVLGIVGFMSDPDGRRKLVSMYRSLRAS